LVWLALFGLVSIVWLGQHALFGLVGIVGLVSIVLLGWQFYCLVWLALFSFYLALFGLVVIVWFG